MADVYKWSKTPGLANATSDPDVNWAENQPPATVNDSARAMMQGVAMWRDTLSGTLATGGSGGAWTLTTGQSYAPSGTNTIPDGLRLTFRMPTTQSGLNPTLAVDSVPAKKLIKQGPSPAPNTTVMAPLNPFDLRAGTIYEVIYNKALDAFQLMAPAMLGTAVGWGSYLTGGGAVSPPLPGGSIRTFNFYGFQDPPVVEGNGVRISFFNQQGNDKYSVQCTALSYDGNTPVVVGCIQPEKGNTSFRMRFFNTDGVPIVAQVYFDVVVFSYVS